MRVILYILQKEFLQIFRNKAMLPIIFVMPFIQLLVLANAATFDVKHVRLHVMDMDHSAFSQRLVGKFAATGYFQIVRTSHNEQEGMRDVAENKAHLVLRIPHHFERDIHTMGVAKVQLLINAEDGAMAGVLQAYTASVIADFSSDVRVDVVQGAPNPNATVDVSYAYWFNPELDYKTFMVPGILVLLVTLIGFFLSGMNVVREKELGTIEQLNVTPIRKYQFIVGKLVPFLVIALAELGFGLLLARVLFHVPMLGSIPLVFGVAAVYLLAVLGFGLLISTMTDTQQQAMFISWFFMVVFILMSGLFTPIESMPAWAQALTTLNPIAYFIKIIRQVLLKGAGIADILQPLAGLGIYAVLMMSLAVLRYRKSSA